MSKKVHIVCVLDRSGSMGSLSNEVVSGFNQFIEDQKKVEGKATVTLSLFNHQEELVMNREDLKDFEELTEQRYNPHGMTGLYDAIGNNIRRFEKKKNVIFLIMTDGYENSSREYGASQIKEMIEKYEEKGWDFNFMGANIDVFAEASKIGINQGKAHSFNPTSSGLRRLYGATGQMAMSTVEYRTKLNNDTEGQ